MNWIQRAKYWEETCIPDGDVEMCRPRCLPQTDATLEMEAQMLLK